MAVPSPRAAPPRKLSPRLQPKYQSEPSARSWRFTCPQEKFCWTGKKPTVSETTNSAMSALRLRIDRTMATVKTARDTSWAEDQTDLQSFGPSPGTAQNLAVVIVNLEPVRVPLERGQVQEWE